MNLNIFGRSVQGASHKRTDLPCQDWFRCFVLDDGTIVMAAADGHGSNSCPYSDTGSKSAVNVFCDLMKELHSRYAGEHEMLLTYLNREGDTRVAQAIDKEWKRRIYERHRDNKRPMPETEDKNKKLLEIYKQYGTTLLGLMITPTFYFAFQLGDGDISYVDNYGFQRVIEGDKILGIETHSLSKEDSWRKAITSVRRRNATECLPAVYMMSTDGFSNSFLDEKEYQKTCVEYFDMLKEHGPKVIAANLREWLNETSAMGCGDDITVGFAFFDAVSAASEPDVVVPTNHIESDSEVGEQNA